MSVTSSVSHHVVGAGVGRPALRQVAFPVIKERERVLDRVARH